MAFLSVQRGEYLYCPGHSELNMAMCYGEDTGGEKVKSLNVLATNGFEPTFMAVYIHSLQNLRMR